MMLFPKALFLATTFPQIVTNSTFLLNVHQKLSKLSQNVQTICIFHSNKRKINTGFLNFFEKQAKTMHFWKSSYQIYFKISKFLWLPGGSSPGLPTRPTPSVFPRTKILTTHMQQVLLIRKLPYYIFENDARIAVISAGFFG